MYSGVNIFRNQAKYFCVLYTESDEAMSSSGTSSGRNLAGVTQGNFSLTGSSVTNTSPFSKSPAGLWRGRGETAVTAPGPTTGCAASLRLTTEDELPRSELDLAASTLFFRRASTSTLCESVTCNRWVS